MKRETLTLAKDAGVILGICVGLVALGVMPRCDEIQTVQAAQTEHKALQETCQQQTAEIKDMVRRIHDYLLRSP